MPKSYKKQYKASVRDDVLCHQEVPVEDTPILDRLLHAAMSHASGLSPASLATAYFDWWIHLASAPGKQIELVQSAEEKAALLGNYMLRCILHEPHVGCCVQPLPQDRRFSHEGWKHLPYNMYQQAFLLSEQWWAEATGNVRGMTRHHRDVVGFLTRQWLDMISPLNFPQTNPRVIEATREQQGGNFLKGAENFFEDVYRLFMQQPPAGAEKYQVGKTIAVTKGKVIYQNRLIELIQYEPVTKGVHPEPILIIPAWIMKYYILDLSPENSLVNYLVKQGYTVFMISWKNPDSGDRDLGFEDYYRLGVMDALDAISAIVPNQRVHGVGYCLGGTLLSIAAAAMARDGDERLKSITLFAAQVDFEEAGELLLFVDEGQLAFLEDVMWEQGYLDKEYMAKTFQMLRSFDLVWSRIVEHYILGERRSMNDLMAWNADATRMPYRMHSEYLRNLFLNNDLSEGRFTIEGHTIALTDIRAPVFAVSTVYDHVAPWHSVYKIRHYTDTDVTFVLTNGGHNAGIISEPGHKGREYQMATIKSTDKHIPPALWQKKTPVQEGSWWPAWSMWLREYSDGKVSPPSLGAPKKGYKILRDAPGKYVLEQ